MTAFVPLFLRVNEMYVLSLVAYDWCCLSTNKEGDEDEGNPLKCL